MLIKIMSGCVLHMLTKSRMLGTRVFDVTLGNGNELIIVMVHNRASPLIVDMSAIAIW